MASATSPSRWDTFVDYAQQAEELIDAPIYDLAAILAVDATWLGGLVLITKAVVTGLVMEFGGKKKQ